MQGSEMITTADGLSDNFTWDLVQDDEGFLWIGTINGLTRYDGRRFLIYNNREDNPNKISKNQITDLFISPDSNLVLINDMFSLDVLDRRTNLLTNLPLNAPDDPVFQHRATVQAETGEIYLICENRNGYKLLQYENRTLKQIAVIREDRPTNPNLTDMRSLRFHFFRDEAGIFWIQDREKGVFLLDASAGPGNYTVCRRFGPADFEGREQDAILPEVVRFFLKDRNGRIWIAFDMEDKVYLYDSGSGRFKLPPQLNQRCNYLEAWPDETGNIAFLTGPDHTTPVAITLVDTAGHPIDYSNLLEPLQITMKLKGKDFRSLIYVVSQQGIRKVRLFSSPVLNFFNGIRTNPEAGVSIRGIAEDNTGHILVNTETGGWFLMVPDSQTWKIRPLIQFDTLPQLDLHPPKFGRNFIKDERGMLWASAYKEHKPPDIPGGYLLRFDPQANTIKPITDPYRIECMARSRSGKFWLAGVEVLQIFDPATLTFTRYLNADGTDPMQGNTPSCILEGQDRILWIATNKGLLRIDPDTRTSTLIRKASQELAARFETDQMLTLFETPEGKLWLGTYGEGIHIYNPATGSVKIYTKADGLADDRVCGFIPEGNGNLWISTFNGLSYFNAQDESFRNFYVDDGFTHNEFNRFAAFRDSRGLIWFGGVNGLNAFRSQDLLQLYPAPDIFLSGISLFDKEKKSIIQRNHGLNELDRLVLPAENRFLHLEFGLSDLAQPELNRYAYFLEGYDRTWNQIGNLSEVTFNNLPPGRYTLLIKGAGHRGRWTTDPIRITILVREFFYKTTWFLLAVFGLATLGIYLLYRYRLNQITRLMHLRTQIAGDLHDEVGGLLVGIHMQMEMMELSRESPAKEKLRRVRELSRDALSRMRDIVWSIDARRDKVQDLCNRMQEQAEEMLAPKAIKYRIKVENLELEKKLSTEVRQTLYLIFKECLANIVKHAAATQVEVHFGNLGKGFEMRVSDNGAGLKNDKIPTGLGLDNIRMRASRIGASVHFQNANGFSVHLTMPHA